MRVRRRKRNCFMSLSRRVGRSVMSQPLYTIKEKRLVLLFSRIVNSLDGLCCSETLIVPWREQSAEKSFDIMIVCLAIARRTHVTYFYSCCLYFFESLKNVRSCCWIIQNNTHERRVNSDGTWETNYTSIKFETFFLGGASGGDIKGEEESRI